MRQELIIWSPAQNQWVDMGWLADVPFDPRSRRAICFTPRSSAERRASSARHKPIRAGELEALQPQLRRRERRQRRRGLLRKIGRQLTVVGGLLALGATVITLVLVVAGWGSAG